LYAAAKANADRAARAGFVLSMIFFAITAIYALSLTGEGASRIFKAADGVAYGAGLRVQDISITGMHNTPKRAILDALKLPYSGSILSYNTAHAHDELLKVGWIEAAEVRRTLPASLEIIIAERMPYARFLSGGKTELIDREGHILGAGSDAKFASLPLFAGEGAPAEAAAFQDALISRASLLARIERAELVAERFWSVRLSNGPVVKLPRKVNKLTLDKLEALLASNKISEMALETIDLRLSHRTILQLRDPTIASRDKAIALLMPASPAPAQGLSSPRKGKQL
jgi:cell division protein FtsQ